MSEMLIAISLIILSAGILATVLFLTESARYNKEIDKIVNTYTKHTVEIDQEALDIRQGVEARRLARTQTFSTDLTMGQMTHNEQRVARILWREDGTTRSLNEAGMAMRLHCKGIRSEQDEKIVRDLTRMAESAETVYATEALMQAADWVGKRARREI